MHEGLDPSGSTIQAFDYPDGTVYILRRPGLAPVSASWPHPLLKLEPAAKFLGCYESDNA